jgi:sugar phosphate isomerase/epimerase
MIDPIHPDLSYKDNLRKAADLGFAVIQLWYRDMVSQTGGNPEEIMTLLGGLHMELKSLGAYMDMLDPERSWKDIYGELRDAIDFAASTGIGYVVTESGGVPGKMVEWREMIGRFSQLAEYAGSRDTVLLVENGPGVLVNDTANMLRMMKEVNSDYLGINFDPANLILVPDDVVGGVKELGGYIRDTHAKDSILVLEDDKRPVPEEHVFKVPEDEEFIHMPDNVRWVLPPVGEGDVPFPEYIAALNEIAFGGDLIIEFQGGGSREEAIVRSRDYLEGLLRKQV